MNKIMFLVSCTLFAFSCAPKYLTYEQFGAKGDGVSDDFPAIIATHAAANEMELPVKATNGKTYYIGNTTGTATVRTDVDFGTAKFIIDDSNVSLENRGYNIFEVKSAIEPINIEGIESLKRDQANIDVTLPGRCLVRVVNDNHKAYIRLGANQDNGTAQEEYFIVDKNGNIDPTTSPIWDYSKITKMIAYPIDEKPLIVKGGIFTTIANQAPSEYTYYCRGISVNRSNVRLENITHYVEGELDHGAPYDGFLNFDRAADIVVSDCILTAHKTYWTIGSAGVPITMGSYDLSAHGCVNVRWENCSQTTDISDKNYWGVFCSNFCKNLAMDRCSFSRFDAHLGVKNVTLTNCTFGHQGVRMVGCGTILLENCDINYKSAIFLRDDYGSSWDGDLIIRNCRLIVPEGFKTVYLLNGYNEGKHDFGYTCYLPKRFEIENLIIDDSRVTHESYTGPMIFGTFHRDINEEGLYPYITKGIVNIKNVKVVSGKALGISRNPEMFKDYTIINNR